MHTSDSSCCQGTECTESAFLCPVPARRTPPAVIDAAVLLQNKSTLAVQVYDAVNELPDVDFGIVQSAFEVILKMLLQKSDLLQPFLQLAGQSRC